MNYKQILLLEELQNYLSTGRNFYADERRPHDERAAKTRIQSTNRRDRGIHRRRGHQQRTKRQTDREYRFSRE